jgi:ABC-type multidrug transport system fused ATPase/permease subunit
MIGNFTGTAMAPPGTERRNSVTNVHNDVNDNARVGSDSSASTIAANPESSPPRGHTNIGSTDPKASAATTNQNSDIASDADEVEMARRDEEVHQLARRYTTQSHYSTTGQNVFNAEPGSALDPNGEHFNARAWCKAMLHMQIEDENASPPRTTGVSFRALNVHGFGTATDYQKSVGNVWLGLGNLVQKFTGKGKNKINILRNVDGLVESGEMLVVLGPPGSGCSTFLKTITGETHGFFVDQNSYLNYQGMTGMQTCNSRLLTVQ